jgi:hypothetical protein
VPFYFDALLDPRKPEILGKAALGKDALGKVHWNTQASGIEIPSPAALQLEQLWSRHIGSPLRLGMAVNDEEVFGFEGVSRRRFILHRSRESRARRAKIAAVLQIGDGALRCEVPGCGFEFEKMYGVLGKNFAEIHHLKPLSDQPGPRRPKLADLAVVCANCHRMIHRHGKCRDLADLIATTAKSS